jgi:hypothetical protein
MTNNPGRCWLLNSIDEPTFLFMLRLQVLQQGVGGVHAFFAEVIAQKIACLELFELGSLFCIGVLGAPFGSFLLLLGEYLISLLPRDGACCHIACHNREVSVAALLHHCSRHAV